MLCISQFQSVLDLLSDWLDSYTCRLSQRLLVADQLRIYPKACHLLVMCAVHLWLCQHRTPLWFKALPTLLEPTYHSCVLGIIQWITKCSIPRSVGKFMLLDVYPGFSLTSCQCVVCGLHVHTLCLLGVSALILCRTLVRVPLTAFTNSLQLLTRILALRVCQ